MSMMWQEIMEQADVTEQCLRRNASVLTEIVREIKARGIRFTVIAARGTSDHAAVYGKYVLESLTRCPVALSAPSIVTIYKTKPDFSDTLVIGISQSGQAADVGAVLEAANEQGAVTVAITNVEDSPLAKTARYRLYCYAGPEKSVAATKTFTAQMILMAGLAAEWSGSTELKSKLSQVPAKIRETFGLADSVRQVVDRYRFMDECFVLARGINYSIALETALKIEETTYVRAKAFAISDFQHGPMAMLQKDMPVVVFAPSGSCEEDAREMIEKARDAQADVLVISDREPLRSLGSCSLPVPDGLNDYVSPFCNVVIAQMFACQLAVSKDLNPDAPRRLHKVTKTL